MGLQQHARHTRRKDLLRDRMILESGLGKDGLNLVCHRLLRSINNSVPDITTTMLMERSGRAIASVELDVDEKRIANRIL